MAFTDGRQIPYRPNDERALADWRLLPHCMRPLLAHRDQFSWGPDVRFRGEAETGRDAEPAAPARHDPIGLSAAV
jgi:hypothetical protein